MSYGRLIFILIQFTKKNAAWFDRSAKFCTEKQIAGIMHEYKMEQTLEKQLNLW